MRTVILDIISRSRCGDRKKLGDTEDPGSLNTAMLRSQGRTFQGLAIRGVVHYNNIFTGFFILHRQTEEKSQSAPALMPRVTAIKAYSKGFACSAGPGTVCLFEKTEEKDSYRQIREIRVST